jgi:glycosyltransferase involved in cell wall biosynthesis
MRVLLFIAQFHPIVGGAERQAQALARSLIRRGHEIVVVTRRRGHVAARELVEGVPVFREIRPVGSGPVHGLTYLIDVARSIRRHRRWADVIQVTNIYLEAFVASALRRWHEIPVVIRPACAGYYGDLARLRRYRAWPLYPGPAGVSVKALIRVVGRADAFIANSAELRRELIQARFPSEHVLHISNGVDVEHFRPGPQHSEYRRQTNLPPGPLVLFVGRLDPQKGVATLLAAARSLIPTIPELRVVLLGDGPLRSELEANVRQAGLSERVLFRGVVENVAPYLQAADVFVLPSLGEGMPNALLEAMATGLPCIATGVGGTMDVVTDGEDGLLVEPGNAVHLADALIRLLKDPAARDRLGRAARQTVERTYSLEQMSGEYLRVYQALASRREA